MYVRVLSVPPASSLVASNGTCRSRPKRRPRLTLTALVASPCSSRITAFARSLLDSGQLLLEQDSANEDE